jgi:tetratricopeptide (TPR) repeat protein
LAAKPKDPDLWNKLGSELEGLGDLDGAITAYQKSVALPPKEIGRAFLLRDLAHALEERNDPARGDLDAALAAAQKSIHSWPVAKDTPYCSAEIETLVSIMVKKGDRVGAQQLMQPIFARVKAQNGFGSAFCGEITQILAAP